MQEAEALDEPAPIGEAEYQTLEQTLMESDRGRRFLAEFVKRHKTPETQEILSAIHRLENSMVRQRKVPDLDRIRLDIAEMHEAIERTKNEIANIKAEGGESNRFVDASHELDLIVTQTEGATQTILEAAEQIQEQAWTLREAGGSDEACDEIDAKATEIFMACSFQDLTGQRTTKVVQVLRYLESRINMMINIWGIEDAQADEDAGPVDSRPDAHLLNGPQESDKAVSQNSVDDLFSGNPDALNEFDKPEEEDAATSVDDISFDKIEAQTSEPEAESEVAGEADIDAIMAGGDDNAADEPMDASDIDAMFAEEAAPVEMEDSAETDVAEAVAEDEEILPPDADGADEIEFDAISADDEPEAVGEEVIGEAEEAGAALDEDAIDRLFDAEMAESDADVSWEQTEEQAAVDEANDPLQQLTEAERQALFN
ncbi:protein phosphatase CheZ [Roseibium sp.]|uniref:protein phosphatase CheZ n=1 Tax=Roseibium sp. TaxID=1936156 RepID=UPI003A970580